MTYRQLDERSSQLARTLIARGAGPETVVALALPRSATWIVAVWAVAKTGAAFLPVDPSYPSTRIAHMVSDSNALIGLAPASSVSTLPGQVSWTAIEDALAAAESESPEPVSYRDRRSPTRIDNIAYFIYTSGSTGTPKGVAVTHSGLAPFSRAQISRYHLGRESRTLHFASPSFDAAVLELLLAHAVGATMVIASPDILGGAPLQEMLRENRITHAFLTPSTLETIDPGDLPALEVVVAGGEASYSQLVQRWTRTSHRLEFFNGYGPTETTIMSAISDPLSAEARVTIGGPIDGTACRVLDSRLRPVPDGVAGELYIAGSGLARGYRGASSLTAQRFVADPFDLHGKRMYRTGDIVRWSVATPGALEYVGRNDQQIQIRGRRIEPGEIDAALTDHPGVRFAVTVDHRAPSGEIVLASYLLPEPGRDIDPVEVRDSMQQVLPRHLVPGTVTVLNALPLTPTGKLNRRALPAPAFDTSVEYVAPRCDVEKSVAAVFAAVLGITEVGIDDDFFDRGGTSLLAVRLRNALEREAGIRVDVRMLFSCATVRTLVAGLDTEPLPADIEQLIRDAQLDTDINASDCAPARAVQRNALLTGATGFLGVHLLAELLRSTELTVHCLVRADTDTAARERLVRAARRYRLPDPTREGRVIAVAGDLAAPQLGLTDEQFADLAEELDVIFHNGARVNHVEPYFRMKAANVDGTAEILRLAANTRVKPVHYVSTLSTLLTADAPQPRILDEDSHIPAQSVATTSGYAATKSVGEQLCRQARSRGVPATIHRPGLICGPVDTGAMNTDDAFWNMIRATAVLCAAPPVDDARIALTPVTYVAEAIVRLAEAQPTAAVHHLTSNTSTTAVGDIFAALRRSGYPIDTVAVEEFLSGLEQHSRAQEHDADPSLARAMLVAHNYLDATATDVLIDDTRTRRSLIRLGVRCPRVDRSALDAYVRFYREIGFLPATRPTRDQGRDAIGARRA